ncbi:SbtR family transcriptional regulator [Mycobacterium sp.]|uniref:SbtR family transcriptional regulator n=1 Tax=Mycobacterium sp. TaxID=1785 RepID=UPI003F9BDDDA
MDRALANPRAWDGFAGLVFELCEMQAGDAGLRDLLTTAFPASSAVEHRTNEAVEKVRTLIARAQTEGRLRSDLVAADVVVMLLANAGVLRTTGASAPNAWRRFAALMVDAFRARPETPLPPAPPEQQLRRSIALLTEGR